MPLTKGMPVGDAIKELYHHGSRPRPMKQIVAIAESNHRRADGGFAPVEKLATGGFSGLGSMQSQSSPSWAGKQAARDVQHEQFHGSSGLFGGTGAGRTDRLPRSVPADSFVFPADVVSILGQNHTAAGGKILDGMMGVGPYHTSLASKGPKVGGGAMKFAEGGDAHDGDDGVSHVLVASGEYLGARNDLARIGGMRRRAGMSKKSSDIESGHEWARDLVDRVRKAEIKRLKKAPKPKS